MGSSARRISGGGWQSGIGRASRRISRTSGQCPGPPEPHRSASSIPKAKRHDYDVVITNLLEDPAVGGFVLTLHDITVRKLYARELEALAFVDPLTGLANRARFLDALQALMEGDAIAPERDVTVIFFDLDNFKIVNDSLGHEAGDAVLCEVASRVRQVLDTGDLAARLGGDEFTLLLSEGTDLTTARTVAGRLLEAVKRPIRVAGHHVQVGGSFGIAQGQAGLDTAENLLRKADIAMYRAKSMGKNVYAVYDASFESQALSYLDAQADLRRGDRRAGDHRLFPASDLAR